jgi:uncharacterized phage protein (predicted DNA packaging)
MIITIDEAKLWCRIEPEVTEEDALLHALINAAEQYLYNATGVTFDSTNELAKLFCMVLVTDWYENRELVGKASEAVRYTLQSILAQLQYCYEPTEEVSL